ncbi:MAG: hypothetical protein V1860_03255 [bacterium]
MNKKKLLIILISLAAIILLAVVLISIKKSPVQNISIDTQQDIGDQNNAAPLAKGDKGGFLEEQAVEVAVKEADPEVIEEEGIKTFAKTFYERYGSFSSDDNYKSFDSLRPLMTAQAVKEMEEQVKSQNHALSEAEWSKVKSEFYGVTTKVLSVKVEQKMDLSAHVSISYQKQETIGDEDLKISYGNAEMELVKEGGVWMAEGIME